MAGLCTKRHQITIKVLVLGNPLVCNLTNGTGQWPYPESSSTRDYEYLSIWRREEGTKEYKHYLSSMPNTNPKLIRGDWDECFWHGHNVVTLLLHCLIALCLVLKSKHSLTLPLLYLKSFGRLPSRRVADLEWGLAVHLFPGSSTG